MTALNKQALNPEELESALLELKRISEQPAVSTHYARVLRKHIANLNCALEAAEKRVAELEGMVFSVKLPVAPLQYETLKLCLEPSDGYGMQKGAEYMRDEIIKVLHAAGIGVKGE